MGHDSQRPKKGGIVCKKCGFCGVMNENIGTTCPYIEYCISCGGQHVAGVRMYTQRHRELLAEGVYTYEDFAEEGVFDIMHLIENDSDREVNS